jgi:alkylated DNA repair dioxygenase AlkB
VVFGPNLLPDDGEVVLDEGWLAPTEADELLGQLVAELDWRQEQARFGARVVALPRLTAWYGDVGYRYSGVYHHPREWPPVLADLRRRLSGGEPKASPPAGPEPNSVLVNFYRDGRDSMGWHSDDEPELGVAPRIWSVSLGASRRFLLRHRSSGQRVEVGLGHGSLLVMAGRCQQCWQHSLPKTSRPVGARVNLTFRFTGARSADDKLGLEADGPVLVTGAAGGLLEQ